MRWTFDPLRAINAGLNVDRLGAVVDTYLPEYYDKMVGINSGTPSDRLIANWYLDTGYVADRAARIPQVHPENAHQIAIPPDFAALLTKDPAKSLAERLRVRAEICRSLDDGLVISGFLAKQSSYVLSDTTALQGVD